MASCHWLPALFPLEPTPESRGATASAEDLLWASWRDLDHHDWLGVSCSYALGVGADGSFHPWPRTAEAGPMGWAPWAEAVGHTLHRVAEERSGRPVLLLTGAWDIDDERRDATLRELAATVTEAADGGVPIQQVHWWSAVDGYEGATGFDVRSGLFDRDRNPTGITALGLAEAES